MSRSTSGGKHSSYAELYSLSWCLCLLPLLVGCPQLQDGAFEKAEADSGSGGGGSAGLTSAGDSINVTVTGGGNAGSGGSGGSGSLTTTSAGGSGAASMGAQSGTDSASSTGGGGSGGTGDTSECGDLTVDPDEECDGADLDGATCESAGFAPGKLSCNDDCALDTFDCGPKLACGDHQIQPHEQCEGTDLANETCEKQGFDGGDLACDDKCQFDKSGCTEAPVCDENTTVSTGEVFEGNTSDYESRIPTHSCVVGGEGPDVSFTWTAPDTGYFCISVSSPTDYLDTILSVYEDCSFDTELACVDDGARDQFSQLRFEATAGVTYAVVVDSFQSTDAGAIAVDITTCGGDWGGSGSGSGSGGPP